MRNLLLVWALLTLANAGVGVIRKSKACLHVYLPNATNEPLR